MNICRQRQGGRPMSYTLLPYENAAGETQEIPAYCVTPDQYGVPQTVPEGESIRYLAEEKASDPKVVGLVANMYPHRSLEELGLDNKYQAFYAGKIALWCYLIPEWDISDVTVAPGLTGPEREIGESILNAAVKIYTQGTTWTSVAEPQLTTSPDQEAAYPVTIDGPPIASRYLPSLLRPGWTDRLLMYRSRMGRTYRRAPVLRMRTTRILPRSRSPIPETATRGPSRCSTQRTA